MVLALVLLGGQVLHASKILLLVSACILLVQCSWWKDYSAKKDLKQVCIKAHAFTWDEYKNKGHIEAKNSFETYLFKDVSSKLVTTVWNESFAQPLELRYSYFSSQLKSFGIETGYCLILEKLFEDQVPAQAILLNGEKK